MVLGVISGLGTGIGVPVGFVNEENWSGFQLVQVLTIGTASIPVPLTFSPGSILMRLWWPILERQNGDAAGV
jgi:hypothetical protein